MNTPDTQPQGETRTLAEQIRACADAVNVAARLDRRHVVAATLRDLADRAAETELRADRAENARDQVGEMLHTAQEQRNQASARWHEERKHAAEAEQQRDLLRGTLTVIRMIVEESATNDADLLRQAILEQLPPAVPVEGAQGGAESNAGAPAAALAGTSAREGAGGSQEPAENCAHCGKPRNGYGNYLGAKVCHTGTNPPDADPIDCYRLVTVYREPIGLRLPSSRKSPSEIAIGDTVWSGGAWFAVARVEQWDNWFQFSNAQGATSTWSADQAVYVREQQPTAPPICPGCEMPETNCCCG